MIRDRHINTSVRTTHNKANGWVSLLLILWVLMEFPARYSSDASPMPDDKSKNDRSELDDLSLRIMIPDFLVTTAGISHRNPEIEVLLSAPKVMLDPRLVPLTTQQERNSALFVCESALNEVLTENSWIPRGQLVQDLKNDTLRIVLVPDHLLHGSDSTGMYLSKDGQPQQIRLAYRSEWSTFDCKSAILDELMSHLVVASHNRCGIVFKDKDKDGFDRPLPFLARNGTIDAGMKQRYIQSIQSGISMIKQVKKLWAQRKTVKLSTENNKLIDLFLCAVKRYSPLTFHTSLLSLGGKVGLEKMIKGGVYQRKGIDDLEPGPNFPKGLPHFYGHIKGDSIFYVHTLHTNPKSLKYKIDAFFGDFSQIESSFLVKEGPYATRKESEQWAEVGTNIARLPTPLLEVFFKDLQDLSAHYLLRCSSWDAESRYGDFFPPQKKNKKSVSAKSSIETAC